MADTNAAALRAALERLRSGEEAVRMAARNELVDLAYKRYRVLATLMLDDFPGLRTWVESTDVFHDALLRLRRTLEAVSPENEQHVRALLRQQIRRELLELLRDRSFQSWKGFAAADSASEAPDALVPGSTSADPARVAEWTEFHTAIAQLPDREKVVFEPIYYEGFTQEEVAGELGCSIALVRLRFAEAKASLAGKLKTLPGGS